MTIAIAPDASTAAPRAEARPSQGEPLVRFVGVQKTYDGVQLVVLFVIFTGPAVSSAPIDQPPPSVT